MQPALLANVSDGNDIILILLRRVLIRSKSLRQGLADDAVGVRFSVQLSSQVPQLVKLFLADSRYDRFEGYEMKLRAEPLDVAAEELEVAGARRDQRRVSKRVRSSYRPSESRRMRAIRYACQLSPQRIGPSTHRRGALGWRGLQH